MKFLAVDFGARRFGLALSDEAGRLALPHGVHTRKPNDNRGDIEALVRLAKVNEIGGIVFGLPGGSAGSEETARVARNFVAKLETAAAEAGLELEFHWWDERFSTAEVLRGLAEAGISQRRAREAQGAQATDARAAAVILQGFLDSRNSGATETDSLEMESSL
jgi:putative Holliday junction resolvase